MDIEDLVHAAREHADRLASDLELCSTREEHVRMTARANEAESVATDLYNYMISKTAADTLG